MFLCLYLSLGLKTVWEEVYGFDMSVIKEIALTEPLVDVVEGKVRRKRMVTQHSRVATIPPPLSLMIFWLGQEL